MKKILSTLLAIMIALTLISCGETGAGTEDYEDNYLYIRINHILHRVNVETATAVPLCPDPLCTHSDFDCPYYGIDEIGMKTAGQYIYFMRRVTSPVENPYLSVIPNQLCRMDLSDGSLEVLYEPDGAISQLLVIHDCVYFNLETTEMTELGGGRGYVGSRYHICRYDLKTKKVKYLTEEPLEELQYLYYEKDGRLYWNDHSDKYSTDLDYRDRREEETLAVNSVGNYRFVYDGYVKNPPNVQNCLIFGFTREDMTTGERIRIMDAVPMPVYVYGEKLIYRKLLEEPVFVGYSYILDAVTESYDQVKNYDAFGGKLYICDLDGGNERLLCDLSEGGYVLPGWSDPLGEKLGIGNVIAIETWRYVYEEGTQDILSNPQHIFLIDITTGEAREVQVETRS